MIVINSVDVEGADIPEGDPMLARGKAYMRRLIEPDKAGGSMILLVTFSPGARLNFHTHTYEQILYVTEGKGIVATEKEEQIVTAGTVIYIPPGEVHWHGATEASLFSHIAIQKPGIKLAE